jgi:DNA repair photolyase
VEGKAPVKGSINNSETKLKEKRQSVTKTVGNGTQEWSVKSINCCSGCSHDCRYCYAKERAIRCKQLTASQWPLERIRPKDVTMPHKKYDGQVMFPSSHDITPNNLNACLTVLGNLLDSGNRVLVVSKPHLECIKAICERFEAFKDRILYRFTIGAYDDQILAYWETNAPVYDERKASLIHAHESGFQTSISVEPMLDARNIDTLISELMPYVTNAIWIGKMNHLGRFGKDADPAMQAAIDKIRGDQTDSAIKSIYNRHRDNPMIKWKKEIKKVVGIPLAGRNGMDI